MILFIDTADNNYLRLELRVGAGRVLARSRQRANRRQGEKLLPAVDKLLARQQRTLADLKQVVVASGQNRGSSFTAVRVGVTTANALAYGLGIAVADEQGHSLAEAGVRIVPPVYQSAPLIGQRLWISP